MVASFPLPIFNSSLPSQGRMVGYFMKIYQLLKSHSIK